MTPKIAAARMYVSLGWGVVPLSADKKVPVLKGWPKYPFTDPQAVSNHYARNPLQNIGIVAGYSGLVCVDCDGPEGKQAFADLVASHGGERGEPLTADTPSGGEHNVYRHPGGIYIKSRAKRHGLAIDIKADGGQFAVEPSTGREGLPYKWRESPSSRQPGPLPAWLLDWIQADDTPEEKAAKQERTERIIAERNGSYHGTSFTSSGDRLQHLLSQLENVRQRSNTEWQACCPAHESKGRNSLSVSVGHTQPIVLHCFAGCDAEDIAAACGMTIFDLMDELPDACEGVDLSHLLNGHAKPAVENLPPPVEQAILPASTFPMECVEGLTGLIGEIVRYDLATARCPQPVLALLGALSLMSVLTGRKVRTKSDLRSNIYGVCLAPASAGKNHSRMVIKRILHAVAPKMLGNDRVGSHAGIISLVQERPAVLMPLDEIGDLFAAMREGGAKSGQTKSIEPVLKALYSESGSVFLGDAYADRKRDPVKINQPHLVLYGSCPGKSYWDNITLANIENGLLARFIVFEVPDYVEPVFDAVFTDPPEYLLEMARKWARWVPGNGGNLEEENPTPAIITMTPEAIAILRQHELDIYKRLKDDDERLRPIWGRCWEKTVKLAMLRACSSVRDPAEEEIVLTESDAAWGKKLALWCTRRMVKHVIEDVAEGAEERTMKRIVKMIREAGAVGVPQSEICKKIRDKQVRQRALADLVEAQICTFAQTKNGNSYGRTWYMV